MIAAYAIVAYVVIARLIEVAIAMRNTKALMAQGAVEHGAGHYPVIVALHVAWLVSLVAFLPRPFEMHWAWLAAFALLQILRVWTMASLGPWFTTRIVTLDTAPLVATGPYRFLRHPNYAIVIGEIVSLPLAFGETAVALVFLALNVAMLAWRIRVEDRALAARRARTETAVRG
ncbi:MAG TPA: isoprenylcysteine carboxylmethyltransferase family protein [Rhizomicrobium sp.]|nr:isoprenylcysteine carboxylmethyltransferase family protein [Rhizomicrobium sp.]